MIETLKYFCEPRDCREIVKRPFNYKGHAIATTGHYAVCYLNQGQGIEPPKTPLSEVMAARFDQMIGLERGTGDSKPEYNFDLNEVPDCPDCFGTGISRCVECPECGGRGAVDLENDFSRYYDIECKTCNGEGSHRALSAKEAQLRGHSCQTCNGIGKHISGQFVLTQVKGLPYSVNGFYIAHMAARLPNLTLLTAQSQKDRMACFTFDGGTALLMGMNS